MTPMTQSIQVGQVWITVTGDRFRVDKISKDPWDGKPVAKVTYEDDGRPGNWDARMIFESCTQAFVAGQWWQRLSDGQEYEIIQVSLDGFSVTLRHFDSPSDAAQLYAWPATYLRQQCRWISGPSHRTAMGGPFLDPGEDPYHLWEPT